MTKVIESHQSIAYRATWTYRRDYPDGTTGHNTVYAPWSWWNQSLTRHVVSVDPRFKFLVGPYYRRHLWAKGLPSPNSTLRYTGKWVKTHTTLHVSGPCSGFAIPADGLLPDHMTAKLQLINQALDGIKSETINLAVFFRELDSTMKLIGNSARRIADGTELIARGKFTAAARMLRMKKPKGVSRSKHTADNYLAFKFGIMQLTFDAVDAAKHLATRARHVSIRASARLNEEEDKSLNTSRNIFNSGVQDEYNCHFTNRYKHHRFQQVVLWYSLQHGYWDEASRLGFTNGGVATWESLPYSFVVDTFLNIGQWLGDMDLGLGTDFQTGSFVQGYKNAGVVTARGAFTRPNTSLYKDFVFTEGVGSDMEWESYELKRSKLTAADMTYTLLFRSPISVNNAITDTALVVQRLGSTKR